MCVEFWISLPLSGKRCLLQCEFLTVALPLKHVIALTGVHLCRFCASVRAIRMRPPMFLLGADAVLVKKTVT